MTTLKDGSDTCKMVTLRVDRQLLGVPVEYVRDVLKSARITHVPLAPVEVLGAMNLRGRIVTVMDMRARLRLLPTPHDLSPAFIVCEAGGEYFGLRVDSVGEVMEVAISDIEKKPSNLPDTWHEVASGVYRLPDELLVCVDMAALLAQYTMKESA